MYECHTNRVLLTLGENECLVSWLNAHEKEPSVYFNSHVLSLFDWNFQRR